MLTKLKITKLFGLYDYDLTFSSSTEDKIRFITAPNGYGKSTILRLIDGIFNLHLDVFFKVPFQSIQFVIDETILRVDQIPEQRTMGEDSEMVDSKEEMSLAFSIGASESAERTRLTLADVTNRKGDYNIILQQIELFFSSESCKFIDDRRLLRENDDASELVRLSDLLKEKLVEGSDRIERQVSVLRDIINRSDFANKYMELNSSFGFRFVIENEEKTKLEMKELSSGEQHILLLSLYMLFDAPEKAIVLIDEPEMSFHLSWQGDYLKNLKQIVALRNVQCIIATHSPHVFNSDWDLSLDLYELSHPRFEE